MGQLPGYAKCKKIIWTSKFFLGKIAEHSSVLYFSYCHSLFCKFPYCLLFICGSSVVERGLFSLFLQFSQDQVNMFPLVLLISHHQITLLLSLHFLLSLLVYSLKTFLICYHCIGVLERSASKWTCLIPPKPFSKNLHIHFHFI